MVDGWNPTPVDMVDYPIISTSKHLKRYLDPQNLPIKHQTYDWYDWISRESLYNRLEHPCFDWKNLSLALRVFFPGGLVSLGLGG